LLPTGWVAQTKYQLPCLTRMWSHSHPLAVQLYCPCPCHQRTQVELAQTEYQLPRLTRMWSHLDRVGGGGAVKGTGQCACRSSLIPETKSMLLVGASKR